MKAKMILGFAIILIIVAGVSTFHFNQVGLIKQQILHQNAELDKQKLALELKLTVNELDAIKSNYMVSQKQELIEKFNEERQSFYKLVETIAGTASNAEERKWSAKLTTTSKEYTATFDTSVEIANNKSLNALEMMVQLESAHDLSQVHKEYIFELVDNFNKAYTEDANAAITSSEGMLDETASVALLSLFGVIAVTGITALLLIRSFVTPIKKLQQAVKSIAEGDLRFKINSTSKDELGALSSSFDHMIDQVRSMLANTQAIASYLAEHSNNFRSFSGSTAAANADIIRSIKEISNGADQQAAQSEQSSFIIGELEQEIEMISEFTRTVQSRSREAAFNTHTGSTSMEALKQATRTSEEVLDKVYQAMESLSVSTSQINKIVNTISDISHQTNVLAINAAIEAARAGVHGRGFSVIAEEVRQLSAQTNESSKLISTIIRSLLAQTNDLELHLSDARKSFDQQNGKMSESMDAFQQIRGSMDELSLHIDHIQEQIVQAKAKNGKLVESVQFVAAIAQETAAGVEEVSATSIQQDSAIHQIAAQADDILILSQRLFEEINKFQIGDLNDPQPASTALTASAADRANEFAAEAAPVSASSRETRLPLGKEDTDDAEAASHETVQGVAPTTAFSPDTVARQTDKQHLKSEPDEDKVAKAEANKEEKKLITVG
jgi:methyl-accepting chemotaxis protein